MMYYMHFAAIAAVPVLCRVCGQLSLLALFRLSGSSSVPSHTRR